MMPAMRAWSARLALIAAAVAPFVPAAVQFVERGVPDYLFTGDGATLELRTLHAAHGVQLLGPYSRFHWSHPGPTFFYLAAPIYEAFHEHGPALNLFMFVVNLVGAVAIVLVARRLRGDPFAWIVAALLAVLELVALPFLQTGEWNPVSPIFPLVLLSFLAAAVASGLIGLLPAFALIASAIVQTHIGYLPEVAVLCGVAAAGALWRMSSRREGQWHLQRTDWWIALATAAVLMACWSLPLYESAAHRPGNLRQLLEFFSAPHSAEHSSRVVLATVFHGLSVMPVAIARSWRIAVADPGPMAAGTLAVAEFVLVGGALVAAWRRRDATLAAFAVIAVGEIVAAAIAVRAMRGGVLPEVDAWIAVPGFMALVAGAAWLAPERGLAATVWIAAGVMALVLVLLAPIPRAPVFRDADVPAEQLAHDVQTALAAGDVTGPVVRIASDRAWPTAAAVVLYLAKNRVPVFVEHAWVFMFGAWLADYGREHPSVIIGDRSFADRASDQPQLTRLAHSGDVFVFLEPAGFLEHHRTLVATSVVSASGISGNAHLIVDGKIPIDGSSWNSAASVVLPTTSSSVTVAVPKERVDGFFASVDGNDLYTIRCVGGPDLSWSIGVEEPNQGATGMRTRLLFSDRIGECKAIQLAPASGDGDYSVAEIGFLRK